MLHLHDVMLRLAHDRPVFHSEADFQHALAWRLHLEHPDARIRLEYRPYPGEKIYIDVWCELNGQSIAIELKYPTKRTSITAKDGERFELAEHGAQDLTRYDIVKDIVRVERAMVDVPATAAAAIVLTNDPLYWSASRRSTPSIDETFRVHEGRTLAGPCSWATHAGAGTTKGRTAILDVRGTYRLEWRPYSSFTEHWGKFKFLVVEPISVARPAR